MKKIILGFILAFTLTLVACTDNTPTDPSGFDADATINVYTRDTSSGTRAGFMEKIGFEEAAADDSVLVDDFVIAGNSEIIAAVQDDVNAIGYVSLSTLNESLFKALNFDTVEPTEANVLSLDYKLARKFNYMLRDDYSVYGDLADEYEAISNAFVAYMTSTEGLTTIKAAGGIVDVTAGTAWDTLKTNHPICSADNSALTVKFGGSDSVEKIAKALSADFAPKCGNFTPEHNHTGSSNAYKGLNGANAAVGDALSIMIGFASREFKDSEPALVKGVVAIDAIVAIVNLGNPVNNVSAYDLKQIYSGDVTTWKTLVERQQFDGDIKVYTRDTSSGTRAGFMEKIGFEEAAADDSLLVDGFVIAGNSEIIAAVQDDVNAIGYVSLSTLDESLFKGLMFEGVAPTEANVLSGEYLLARRFNYMLRDDYSVYGDLADEYEAISNAFVAYMTSTEGLTTIKAAGGIVDVTSGTPWDTLKANHPICSADNSALTVKFGGSDSVEKVAKALSADFAPKCGNFTPEHNHTGSSNAYKGLNGANAAVGDALSIMIGFASREFKDSEPALIKGVVAIDAIVAIVNLDNPFENITASTLRKIYAGDIETWDVLS
ncbi:MAG: substrate-binding domain-containing protein [Acholeplasmataceae bacterium]|jgi:phosphate transport system substrate-binding protein|nr:substrate-binding domain-containing protein [Acholeplasmataceae bacterium]